MLLHEGHPSVTHLCRGLSDPHGDGLRRLGGKEQVGIGKQRHERLIVCIGGMQWRDRGWLHYPIWWHIGGPGPI